MDEEYIKLLQQQAAAGSEMAIFQLQQLGYDARIPDADASHLTFEALFPYAKTLKLGMAPIRAFNAARFTGTPGAMYRGIGTEGLKDLQKSGVLRPRQNISSIKVGSFDIAKDFNKVQKGVYASPSVETAKRYGKGVIAEIPEGAAKFRQRYKGTNWSQKTQDLLPVDNINVFKQNFFGTYKPVKFKHGGSHDTDLDKVKKGLRYVESSGGLKMINPNSSATGLYGQLYNAEELQNMPYLQGVDRQSFASDTTLQNRLFEDRYYGKIPGVPGLGRNANDLRVEYKKVLEDKGIPFNYTDDEISALSNLLGRQGTREYFGYVLRDGRSLADVFPKIYGPDAEAPNKTPEKYLETYREGRDLKYGGPGNTTPDRQQQLKDFQSFYGNYINSPKYRERLESSGYEDIDNIINTRSDALNNIQMNVDPGFTRNFMRSFEYSSPTEKPPQMQVSELFPREDEFGIMQFMPQQRLDYTIAHEAGHATDAYGVGLNPKDRMALEDYNQLYRNAPFTRSTGFKEGTINPYNEAQTTVRRISDDKPKYWDNFGVKEGALHDIGSAESYADLVATRKYLFDNYNLSPENDITEEQWKNISKSFDPTNSNRGDSNLSIKRFFEKYKKPEDATYILNNVAMESPQDTIGTMAKYGGQIMKKINKYKNGGDPPKKHKDYLQYNPNYPFTGWVDSPYSYERLQNRITEDSLLLQDSWFPSNELMRNLQINREYRDKVKPYTKEELYDLKYEGDQSKAYGGRAIPQAGFGDMFKKLGQQIKTGLTGAVEGVTGGLVPATKLLRPELRQTYADEMKMGNLFGSTVGFLGGAGLFSGAGAANAATSAAGMSSVPGANTFNALYGSGINPAMMNPSLAGQASAAGASGFGNLFNMGSNFGVGNTASGMFNIYQQGQEGFAMGGRATNPPFMSAMNRPKDVFIGPLGPPTEKINALKSEIARLEEAFKREESSLLRRGKGRDNYSTYNNTMRNISSQAIKAQEELKRLTGKNTDSYKYLKRDFAMGGKTNMKQDIGQDINVESGELLMSAEGGQFQSMNPKAPIKEVMPGVSLVQGNQSNDNVPLKLPDGETMVFSKRLGYADKGLELVNQYKDLEKSPDPDDFIGQQTKKFQLKRIKDKLQKLFREQESSKSKKIAKKTGNPQIPGAGLGDLFTKAKGFLQSDGFKQFGNKALEFAKDNPEALYNIGQGLFAKDLPQIDASQYMTQFEPDPSLTKIDMDALMSPIRNQVASSQYNILRGGGSPAEKIAASMQLSGKAGSQLAAQEAKGQMLQNQLGLNIFERQAEIDRNNKNLALRLDMMNEQRGAARDMFFKEAVSDMGQYRTAKRGEDFMADLYNQRFGTPTTTGGNAGTGTGFNFSLGNMSQPSLGNFGLFDNYQGLNQ